VEGVTLRGSEPGPARRGKAVSRLPSTKIARYALALSLSALLNCSDGTGSSPFELHLFVNPEEMVGERQPESEGGWVLCPFDIWVWVTGGVMEDIEWTGSRQLIVNPGGTTTLEPTGDEVSRRFFQETSTRSRGPWAWGGPENLLPVTMEEMFYFKRLTNDKADSIGYTFTCR
jgi:hypothetical protein